MLINRFISRFLNELLFDRLIFTFIVINDHTFYLICLSFAFFSLYLHSSKKNLWVIFIILIFYSLHRIKCSCCETMAVFFGLFFAVKNRVVYSDIVHDKLDSYPFFMMLLVLVQIDSYTSSKFSSLIL